MFFEYIEQSVQKCKWMSDLTDLESENTNMQCTESLPKGHKNVDLDHAQSDSNYNWETSLPRLHIFKDYGLYKRITFDPKKKIFTLSAYFQHFEASYHLSNK